jgi:hypothetical protein
MILFGRTQGDKTRFFLAECWPIAKKLITVFILVAGACNTSRRGEARTPSATWTLCVEHKEVVGI